MLLKRITKKNMKVKHTLFGSPIMDTATGGKRIKEYILSRKPCMIARIGSVEMQAINALLNVENGLRKEIPSANKEVLYNNAGFFPCTDKAIKDFYSVYREACRELDVAAVLLNRDEDYFYRKYAPNTQYITLTALEPYYCAEPWSSALENKNVLVIHPFAKTISEQYKNRDKLFSNKDVLPNFNLTTMKAVQTIGDNTEGYESWFDALESMKKQIDNVDFDVAIIGCGAYAFPLAAHIKKQGKCSIVMGGATQILFGIKGKRWEKIRFFEKLLNNKYWVKPNQEEMPEGFEKVEGGCYW